ncbi:hypothetical protein [Lawsonia intracellularis]|uniref:hypothetical protein n=1 Tax=Lawsonia intracellularis TaxID=29546 RepID=UPI0021E537FC|nr:hypothetical protein [Lawsonia intracellularis]UYH52893.1 hypothetical protein OCT60_06355 [Lawsonia intracellularis]
MSGVAPVGVFPLPNPDNYKDNPVAMYAFVLLLYADSYRQASMNKMDELEVLQGEQKEANDMIGSFNQKLSEVEKAGGGGVTRPMTAAEKAWCDKNGINVPGYPNLNAEKWTAVIKDTQKVVDTKSTDIQSTMNIIKEATGQYSSFMQGTSTNVTASNQMLNSIAKNIA